MKAKVILATILILAASCVKNEVREVSIHGDGQILYNPAPLRSMTTKAVSTIDFPTTSTFGSCAWYLPGDNKWDDHHAAENTAAVVPTPYIEPSVISYDEDSKVWRNKGKTYYWPMNGSLTFISWTPYKDSRFDVNREEGFKITGWTMGPEPGYGIVTSEGGVATTDPNVDILLSYTKDCTRNTANGKVLTKFSHLLCKVKVVASLAKPGDPWTITSVKLSNIYTKANYSTYVTYVENGANKIKLSKLWRDQDVLKPYVHEPTVPMSVNYDKDGKNGGTVIFPETLFLPQFLTERKKGNPDSRLPKITIKRKNGENEQELTGLLFNGNASSLYVWNQGRSIIYYVTLGEEDTYIDFDAKVEDNDWTDSDSFNVGVGEIINGK